MEIVMLKSRINLLTIVLLFALTIFQYRLWFESGGVRDLLKLKKTLALQETENMKLQKRNNELMFQIDRLKHSQDAEEARARNELGMIKKGETFYQVVKG
jgi:cell division protein FtsB